MTEPTAAPLRAAAAALARAVTEQGYLRGSRIGDAAWELRGSPAGHALLESGTAHRYLVADLMHLIKEGGFIGFNLAEIEQELGQGICTAHHDPPDETFRRESGPGERSNAGRDSTLARPQEARNDR